MRADTGGSLLPAPLLTARPVLVAWAGSWGACSRASSPEEFFNLLPPGISHPSPDVSEASLIYCLTGPRDTLDPLLRRSHVSQLTHWCLFKCFCVLVSPTRSVEPWGCEHERRSSLLREAGRQPSTRMAAAGGLAGTAVTGGLGSCGFEARTVPGLRLIPRTASSPAPHCHRGPSVTTGSRHHHPVGPARHFPVCLATSQLGLLGPE